MGQNVLGVMYGCDVGGKTRANAVWDHVEVWNEEQPRDRQIEWAQDSNVFGVFVCCQGGDDKGVADVTKPLPIGGIAKMPRAREAAAVWSLFVTTLPAKLSERLGSAELWLVETEVA